MPNFVLDAVPVLLTEGVVREFSCAYVSRGRDAAGTMPATTQYEYTVKGKMYIGGDVLSS